jgi:hypothetical protein
MLRKVLVVLGWAAGGLVALFIVLYLIVVAINWHDAEPSAVALRMEERFEARPAVRDEDNAFVYVMGFDVEPGESPAEIGLKRIDWLRKSEGMAELDLAADPLGNRSDTRAARHPLITSYYEACGRGGADCSAAFQAVNLKFDEWNGSEAWLLERYRTLLDIASWREFVSSHATAPLASYGRVFEGQKVLLLHARIRAAKHDAAGARELLSEDLRFWRGVLESSDLLITKMLATSAVNRHFKLGADVLRQLPPEQVPEAVPDAWRMEITDAERSMQRWMTGEWMYVSGIIRRLDRDLAVTVPMEDGIAANVWTSLSAPLFQPQDTINRYAKFYTRVVEELEGVTLAEYEAAANRVSGLSDSLTNDSFLPKSMYNIVGQKIIGYGADFGSYVRRVGDIEGVRRAALAAVSLHQGRVAGDDIPAALAASPLRNPYDGEPFAWDATAGDIVFRGLERGERGEHRIH